MKRILSLAIFLLFVFVPRSQNGVPYNWTYSAKKVSDNVYELHFRVELNSPWHTYSQFTPDGGPVPTKFSFTKNPLYTLDGTVKENGSLIQKHKRVFVFNEKYLTVKEVLVKLVKLKSKQKKNLPESF